MSMEDLMKKVMNGVPNEEIVPKVTKTTTQETTSFVRLDEESKLKLDEEPKQLAAEEKERRETKKNDPEKDEDDVQDEQEDPQGSFYHPLYEGYRDSSDPYHDRYPPRWWGDPRWGNNYRSNYSNYGGPHGWLWQIWRRYGGRGYY